MRGIFKNAFKKKDPQADLTGSKTGTVATNIQTFFEFSIALYLFCCNYPNSCFLIKFSSTFVTSSSFHLEEGNRKTYSLDVMRFLLFIQYPFKIHLD